MIRKILLTVTVILVSGCATQNVAGISTYKAVPEARIFTKNTVQGPNGMTGTVIVKRDHGMLGAALSSTLLIDGQPTAKIKAGEFLQFPVSGDEHIFGVAWSDNLGPLATSSTREVAITIQAGKVYYLRMFPQLSNGIAIERVSQ